MAFQLGDEGSLFGSLDLTLKVEQYFFRTILAHGASWSWYILQFNLACRAIFLALAACIPSPLSSLGFTILFQPTRCIFFFSLMDPHKKSLFILSNLSHTWTRSATSYIMWFGMADTIDLIRTARPTKDKNLVFQLTSLFINLSTMKLYCLLLGPLWLKGKP